MGELFCGGGPRELGGCDALGEAVEGHRVEESGVRHARALVLRAEAVGVAARAARGAEVVFGHVGGQVCDLLVERRLEAVVEVVRGFRAVRADEGFVRTGGCGV